MYRRFLMSKNHRGGKKYCGRHTTVSPAAGKIADSIINRCNVKISLGRLVCGLRPTGKRWIKVTDLSGCMQVKVRDSISLQTLKIYTKNKRSVLEVLEKAVKKHNFNLVLE
jgi:chorismate synthase